MNYKINIFFLFVSLLLFSCSISQKHLKPELQVNCHYEISSVNGVDSAILKTIQPYKDSIDKIMNTVIGYSSQIMSKGFPEGLLGNFVADLMLESVAGQFHKKVDFSLVNNGGLRANLPMGNITQRHVYELMPFDNEVVILELRGSTVNKLIQSIANGDEMAVSGLRMTVDKSVVVEKTIQGNPVDTAKTYFLLTSDYLASGGSDLDFLKEALKMEKLNVTVRDMIINYIQLKTEGNILLEARKDGRIQFIK